MRSLQFRNFDTARSHTYANTNLPIGKFMRSIGTLEVSDRDYIGVAEFLSTFASYS